MGTTKALVGRRGEEALQVLQGVCALLDKYSLPYWLEAGTLLGIIREDRLLPWDTDVDISISSANVSVLLPLLNNIRSMGYRVKIRRFKQATGPFQKGQVRLIKIQTKRWGLFKKENIMDIFIKYKNQSGHYEWVIGDKEPVLKRSPASFFDNLGRHFFNGYYYSVPKEAKAYLAYHYGPDWQIPKKTWDYKWDDFCDKESLS